MVGVLQKREEVTKCDVTQAEGSEHSKTVPEHANTAFLFSHTLHTFDI